MKKFLILFILLISFHLFGKAQNTYQEIVDHFFGIFQDNPLKAYEDLFADNKWVERSVILKNKIDFKDFLTDLGDYCGNELITKKELGKSYVLLSFLVKFERQPFRIQFVFYKPKSIWILQNFSYDTNFSNEVEDAARYDRLYFPERRSENLEEKVEKYRKIMNE